MGHMFICKRGRKRACFLLLFCGALPSLSGCGETPRPAEDSRRTDQIEKFLEGYWARPLAAQGMPPARTSALEASLEPKACGACHAAQFDDWEKSLHGLAMGPGIMGQLVNMSARAMDEHQACIRCHAPLKEQAESLVAFLAAGQKGDGGTTDAKEVKYPPHEQGLTCAACHMRGYQRYGPPRKDGSSPDAAAKLPHNGWISTPAFEDSRFCAACHQFEKDAYALNGKLLENTYEEWKASRYSREGKTCQSCHMPERRHLWRGIHDTDMVKSAVTINVTPASTRAAELSAALTIQNTGAGHYFPTYVTPKVVVEAYQENAKGKMLPGTQRQYVIGRQVSLDLSEEIADTRIAPDERARFDYQVARHRDATFLIFRVRVEPDAFYMDFYRSLLEGTQAGRGKKLIRNALKNSVASAFTLYLNRQPLEKNEFKRNSGMAGGRRGASR